jgi:hypothetical protein
MASIVAPENFGNKKERARFRGRALVVTGGCRSAFRAATALAHPR